MKLLKALIAGALVLVVIYGFFEKILINMPTDTAEKYRQMKSDMGGIVARGGAIVFSKENDRGSAVLITRGVDSRSVDVKLLDNYRNAFASQGWRIIDSSARKISYCKEGVLATLNLAPEWFPGKQISVYGLTMEYNSGTMAGCKQ
ncbi:hypothetical protein [Burkholderia stagnalis]|uniref:hypothetical protein n=1 Tax=Burkholderia stagnalis TaxID=1503054 RepID=UPI000AD591ED|nr:hypothetical protein [Burkholderia stagnalis]MDY7803488.1 hypothetical protein [Burkholderia stagnalis]